MAIRKRTIYIDIDLDKEFAKAAIDAELTFSKMAEDAFKLYLRGTGKKGKGAGRFEIDETGMDVVTSKVTSNLPKRRA